MRVKSWCSGESSSGLPVELGAGGDDGCGRSWEMCAFMPASANWMGWVWSRSRASNSGAQAGLTRAGLVGGVRREVEVREVHVEAAKELASLEGARVDGFVDERVTCQYMRLK